MAKGDSSLTSDETRIRDGIMALGSPRAVLPVAFFMGATQAHSDGQTVHAFVARVTMMAMAVWGEAFDPRELAAELIRAVK